MTSTISLKQGTFYLFSHDNVIVNFLKKLLFKVSRFFIYQISADLLQFKQSFIPHF